MWLNMGCPRDQRSLRPLPRLVCKILQAASLRNPNILGAEASVPKNPIVVFRCKPFFFFVFFVRCFLECWGTPTDISWLTGGGHAWDSLCERGPVPAPPPPLCEVP